LPFYVSAFHVLKGSIPLVPNEIAEKLRKTPKMPKKVQNSNKPEKKPSK
jgi:hypothetical protein